MKPTRRVFLQLTAGAAAAAHPRLASALDYPIRPMRLINGFAAGGAADISARLVAQWLSERFDRQCIVEDHTGAGGNIATEEVVRAAPDGHTLLNCTFSNALSASLFPKLKFDFVRDIAPVAGSVRLPLILLVHPSVAAKTVPEFIAFAKANPGKIDFPSAGIGSSEHMAGELFKMMAGVDLVHVPFRGGAPAITALIAGQVQAYFCATPTSLSGIKAGMRALAVTTAARSELLPDVPTIGETLSGYEVSVWFGIGAPKRTPGEIIGKLNEVINIGLAEPAFKKRVGDLGGAPMPTTVDAFGELIAAETEKWSNVVRAAKVKVE